MGFNFHLNHIEYFRILVNISSHAATNERARAAAAFASGDEAESRRFGSVNHLHQTLLNGYLRVELTLLGIDIDEINVQVLSIDLHFRR